MKHKVIDNFLDKEYFDSLVTLFTAADETAAMPWYFQSRIAYMQGDKWSPKLFYMNHVLYKHNQPRGPHYDILIPLLDKLEVRCLIRGIVNLYPNTHTLHEHAMHRDYPFIHSGALFSLNTCDGYTKLKDGTKIDSVANRVLLFDPSEFHCSTTTTNVPARINININYIQEQFHKNLVTDHVDYELTNDQGIL